MSHDIVVSMKAKQVRCATERKDRNSTKSTRARRYFFKTTLVSDCEQVFVNINEGKALQSRVRHVQSLVGLYSSRGCPSTP